MPAEWSRSTHQPVSRYEPEQTPIMSFNELLGEPEPTPQEDSGNSDLDKTDVIEDNLSDELDLSLRLDPEESKEESSVLPDDSKVYEILQKQQDFLTKD